MTDSTETITAQFTLGSLQAAKTPGSFEIIGITAGEGNGWTFSEDALMTSLSLWDNSQCFVDHAFFGRSVRDLAGVCTSPAWDAQEKGIKLTLKPFGPSADILEELGKQIAADPTLKTNIGFSADVTFTAAQRQVKQIIKVNSLDLVISPARGGKFLRSLNQLRKDTNTMPEETNTTPAADLEKERAAMQALLSANQQQAELAKQAEEAHKVRVQMCAYLLDTGLTAARLPTPAADRIRNQFKDKVFEAAELQEAIEDSRQMISDLTANLVVNGPGRITAMYNETDKLQAAVDDLFDVPRSEAQAKLQVAPLSGVRELYMLLTGDNELHGGYYPDRARLATTADFTGLVKNAMNKIVVATWEQLGRAGYDWWKKVVYAEHFNTLQSITGTLMGTVGSLPSVAEGAEYTELAVGDSPETASFTKYGGYIPLTLELIDRDDTRKLKAYPRELAAAGLRKISALVAAVFTDNAGVGPTMADGGALFNNTAVTTAGGHANLLTDALAADKWDAVCTAVYKQPMLIKNAAGLYGTGSKMAINPRYLLVPRKLQLTAMKIIYPTLENASNIYSENQQRGQPGDVITVPEWTDDTDFAAVCDPAIAPAIFVGERFGLMPEIFIASDGLSPAVFMNDEHRLKVRHFLAVWVNDFRPLHKSNVAG
jgi:hypothetical protein